MTLLGAAAVADRPPVVVQGSLDPPPPDDPTESLIAAVDAVATAWAYLVTSEGDRTRRNGYELLGAAVDALLIARNRYEDARRGNG
jgi:hypothetical protein